jgi:membrane fusion protein (multidrug efflux system)
MTATRRPRGGDMSRKRLWWVLAAGVVLVGGGAIGVALRGADRPAQQAGKKKVAPPLEFTAQELVRLTPKALSVDLALPGTVQAVSQATVRAKLSAEVRRVLVREGDRVVAGQTVAEFDTSQLLVQRAERNAALESARAQLAQAERSRAANAQLVKQNFISQNAFDTADAAYRAQAAAVEAAQAQLAQTELLLKDAVVRAPISGLIARRHVQSGEKVSFDAPLLVIVDLAQLEVVVQAPVSDIGQIARGTAAAVEVEGVAQRFSGKVERINPSAEPGTRTISFYVPLANADALLKAGMFARVRLQLGGSAEVPALPLAAVRTENGVTFVWVIDGEKLARRTIETGRRDEQAQWVEVRSGVAGTDRVLGTRFDNLRDGMAVRVLSAVASDGRAAGSADGVAPRTTN